MKENNYKLAIFLCTGNTCRSPLAEALAHYLRRKHNLKWDFFSAGIKIQAGVPINNNVIQVLSQKGIPYKGRPTVLTKDMIRKATVIFCMTNDHVETIKQKINNLGLLEDYNCKYCRKKRRASLVKRQTRSGDEPMTTFITCNTCKKSIKF